QSRTALLTYIGVSVLYMLYNHIIKKQNKTVISISKDILLIFGLIIIIFLTYDNIMNLLFGKWANSNLDLTSGRSLMWEGTFTTGINILGNGEEYFMNTYNIGDAHNTLI